MTTALQKKDGTISEAGVSRVIRRIATVLSEARTAKGLSLRELSALSGISHNLIHKIERGDFVSLSVATLLRIELSLGLEAGEALTVARAEAGR